MHTPSLLLHPLVREYVYLLVCCNTVYSSQLMEHTNEFLCSFHTQIQAELKAEKHISSTTAPGQVHQSQGTRQKKSCPGYDREVLCIDFR